MIQIGVHHTLEILRFTSVGAFLGDQEGNEILLPQKYLTEDMEIGKEVDVFVYNDSEERPVATTEIPLIELNGFAYLTVKAVNDIGAFMDWGVTKDLFVPFKEQGAKMKEGGNYLVFMYIDETTNRLVGSSRVNRYLDDALDVFEIGDEVDLLICDETELGRKVIVNNQYSGLVFNNKITRPLYQGEWTIGYVEYVRTDGKIDISLDKIGYEKFDEHTQAIVDYLANNNGRMFLTDKSDPEEIRRMLSMSKKSFKKAVGNLYKSKKVVLHDDHIAQV